MKFGPEELVLVSVLAGFIVLVIWGIFSKDE
jgi:hypothetical protein